MGEGSRARRSSRSSRPGDKTTPPKNKTHATLDGYVSVTYSLFMKTTNTATENFAGLAITASLVTGAVKLHLATCGAVRPSKKMYVATTEIDGHVADARASGHKVTRCACCKVTA